MDRSGKYLLSSIDNALKILDILRVRGGLGVSEISRISDIGKSSSYSILYTLERRGYVRKSAEAKYYLGDKFFDNDLIEDSSHELARSCLKPVRRLASQIGETIWVAVLNINGRTVAIVSEEGWRENRAPNRLGFEGEASCIAPGKVLLAHTGKTMLDSLYKDQKMKAYTPNTITSYQVLNDELREIRSRGYACDFNERYTGYGNIAVPIYDQMGRCVASLSMVGTCESLQAQLNQHLSHLKKTAAIIQGYLSCDGQ